MSTGKTTYLGLHRWEPDDDFLRTEFNENSDKLDEELEMMQKEMDGEFSALRGEISTGLSAVRGELTTGLSAMQTAVNSKAASSHSHGAGDITGGTLPVARGGTGNTSVDTTPTSGSTKMVTSGGVYTALSGKAASSHGHGAGEITSGTLGVARGGTGVASWTANRLLYPSAATTMAQLAFPSVAGSVLRQGTSGVPYWTSMADLLTALGAAKIELGSYAGTGKSGSSNPNSITFNFPPKIWGIYAKVYPAGGKMSYTLGNIIPFMTMSSTSVQYTPDATASFNFTVSGNTISWWCSLNDEAQLNESGWTYYYYAIG